MPQTASILIEVDDSAAISSFRQMSAEGAKLGPSLAPVGPALDKVTSSTKQSREAAQLLSEELGVNIPRGLRNILAENSVIGPAISAAFSGIAVAGFVTIVKDAVDQLTGFTAQMDTIAKQNQAIMDTTAQANKVLLGPQNLQQINAQILSTSKSIEKLNYELSLSGDSVTDSLLRGLSKFTSLGAAVVDELDREKAHLNDLTTEQAKLNDEQSRTDPIEILKEQNTTREASLKGIAAITAAEKDQVAVVNAQIKANVTNEQIGQAQIVAIHATAAEKKKEFELQYMEFTRNLAGQGQQAILQAEASGAQGRDQIAKQYLASLQQITMQEVNAELELRKEGINQEVVLDGQRTAAAKVEANELKQIALQNANEIYDAESQAAVALVPPWQRSYAQIAADTQKQLRTIQQELEVTKIDGTEAAELTAAAWQENFAKTRDQLANDMETFFDDLTSGNIGQAFKKMFEDLVFQMVATWILGMNSMRAAASTGFGGGATGILGSLFGFGGGASGGPGGTPTFLGGLFGGGGGGGVPSASLGDLGSLGLLSSLGGFSASGAGGDIGELPISIPGLGLSAGQGSALGGVLPAGASAGIGGLLTKIFPNGLNIGGLSISGAALAAAGIGLGINGIQRGGVLGALEGAGGGALTGFSIGGPVGAAIGAIVGALASIIGGLFGPHTGDTARIQVMEPLLASIKTITDSYDVFQTDYNTGISELETLRTNSLAALKKIGGNQVKGNSAATNQRIDAAEQHLQDTEAERQRRAQINFGPPQFHEGGLVRGGLAAIYGRPEFHGGGEVNANLLIGEGVLNRRAMGVLGESGLNRMNAGGSAGDTYHFTIQAVDAKSFDSYLASGGMQSIAKAWRRASREGMRI